MAIPNLEAMNHVGQAIQALLLNSGITITHTAKHMGIQRSTLYNLFEKSRWPLHRVQAVERLTHQDLRALYPQSELPSPNSYGINREQNLFLQEEIKRYQGLVDEAWEEIARLRQTIIKLTHKK
ncbi:MAG: hypothetical protein ACKO18_06165 [Bacteroidota bacterium]